MGLPEAERVALRRGGIVCDTRKVAVPDDVLLKPGPLDTARRKIREEHRIA
jgi:HD-GYP domain-containing protein (c-di-GMP phosphodiesterase class II)